MPKYYCDYCDTYLTHDSSSVRKTHNNGRTHKQNVVQYYQDIINQEQQKYVDATVQLVNSYGLDGKAAPMVYGIPAMNGQMSFPPCYPVPGGPMPPGVSLNMLPPHGIPPNMMIPHGIPANMMPPHGMPPNMIPPHGIPPNMHPNMMLPHGMPPNMHPNMMPPYGVPPNMHQNMIPPHGIPPNMHPNMIHPPSRNRSPPHQQFYSPPQE